MIDKALDDRSDDSEDSDKDSEDEGDSDDEPADDEDSDDDDLDLDLGDDDDVDDDSDDSGDEEEPDDEDDGGDEEPDEGSDDDGDDAFDDSKADEYTDDAKHSDYVTKMNEFIKKFDEDEGKENKVTFKAVASNLDWDDLDTVKAFADHCDEVGLEGADEVLAFLYYSHKADSDKFDDMIGDEME